MAEAGVGVEYPGAVIVEQVVVPVGGAVGVHGCVDEGVVGGFGSHVSQLLADEGIFDDGLKFRSMVMPDVFLDQDSPSAMYEAAKLSAADIEEKVLSVLGITTLKSGEQSA